MYTPGAYKNRDQLTVLQEVKKEGFELIQITNGPEFVYPRHKHLETKLLVFLKGSPSCTFHWSEKILKT